MIIKKTSVLLVLLLAFMHGAIAEAAMAEPAGSSTVKTVTEAGDEDLATWLLNKGIKEYKAGNRREAVRLFEGVIAIDDGNQAALSYVRRASDKISKLAEKKREGVRAQSNSRIRSGWNQQPTLFGAVTSSPAVKKSEEYLRAAAVMEDRLKAIVIPKVEFANSHVEDVLLFLAAFSRSISGEVAADVDVVLMGMQYAEEQPTISVSFADMNLYDALHLVAKMNSLRVEVRPEMVAVMPANYFPPSQMTTKSYDISTEVGRDFVASVQSDAAVELFGGSLAAEDPTGPIDVVDFFSEVQFPRGASAIYQPRFRKLFVHNTPQNIEAMESMLNDLEDKASVIRSMQVQIEAKFVEFSDGARAELGFDWTLYGTGKVAGFGIVPSDSRGFVNYQKASTRGARVAIQPSQLINAGTPAATYVPYSEVYQNQRTGQKFIGDTPALPGQNLFGAAQRTGRNVFDAVRLGAISTMNGDPAAMVFTDGSAELRLAAMQQEGKVDIMAAPRVVTKSGKEALIRVAETHRYPQDYEVYTNRRTAPVVQPRDWADFDMGISLKVTPVVDPESRTIDVSLLPQMMSFKGYDSYTVAFSAYDGRGNNESLPSPVGNGAPLNALMPFFERRSANTLVTVADGSTIVLGGLIDQRTETFRDQVPFLGDIPIVGRFFRTEGSRSIKKNMMIYVMPSLVDVSGMSQEDREWARKTVSN